ncbi:hypothetical protein AFK20_08615 [Enhydrobacter aerosaccus]|uniref:Protein kinase domain-containing protein n=1 Tax=Enhydrobacter aerosaccus TaxID=225324 RepID=A0ABR5IKM4_9HYPH|nr:hypothetical protein [Enhydrobacter aerosaccus]KND21617.1 hypothetical protein AFK20_08615 [Enhydrobacter aerosaccus]
MPYLIANNQRITIDLPISHEIGSGGMGIVYRLGNLLGTGNLVAKIFKNPTDPKNPSLAKLQAMMARPPEHIYEVINGVGYTQFAWVRHLIVGEHDELIGYAMPELDFDRSLSLNPFMYPREAAKLTAYQQSLNYRVQLCANISALMADLHGHGHAFIDFKEANIRLMPEPSTGMDDDYKGFIVGFIDCDSYRITGSDGSVYPSPVISPEMTSPEYHEHKDIGLLDEKHDRFVLAIELFKILNNGIHPFYFIPVSDRLKNAAHRNTDQFIKERLYAYGLQPQPEIAPLKNSIHVCWDDQTRAMFDKAFLSTNPTDRPSAAEWENHLRGLVQHRQFKVCENYPNDASHIHFVGKPCHRCLFLTVPNNPLTTPVPAISAAATTSVWQTTPNRASVASTAANPPNHRPSAALTGLMDDETLANNRRLEQSLNTQANSHRGTPIQPINVVNAVDDATQTTATHSMAMPDTMADTMTAPTSPPHTTATGEVSVKKPSKGWLIAMIAALVAIGGYGVSRLKSASTPTTSQSATNNQSNNAQAASTDDNPQKKPKSQNSYSTIIKSLPTAKATITQALKAQNGFFSSSSQTSVAKLYQDTLGISPEFFDNVVKVGEFAEPSLKQLQELGYSQDINATKQYSLEAFRNADMGYFKQQPTNKTLAKQLNEAAKSYYWRKKDPKAAVYLQAQAVKYNPNQGEYAANFAYYLFKNNYPYSKSFLLYALQTPRDSSKYPNTYMIELAAAMALQASDDKGAVGSLLAQFYTTDDQQKRCQNMLNYPQTYPELVPIAEKVLAIIDQQNSSGANPVPAECLPPYNWVVGSSN